MFHEKVHFYLGTLSGSLLPRCRLWRLAHTSYEKLYNVDDSIRFDGVMNIFSPNFLACLNKGDGIFPDTQCHGDTIR